jgi:hypothetical protein
MDFCLCFLFFYFFFSPGTMSSDDSPPRVRQRTEESVADRLHLMRSRQVLSERNLLRVDLRDPVLLPITQMLLENNWEYLYNCAC